MCVGEEAGEEVAEESADADNPGVDSISSTLWSPAAAAVNLELRVLFAALSDDTELPEDSSKERLGDRWTRRFIVDGTTDTGS